MSPQPCNQLADIENVAANKYSGERPMYKELTRLAGDRILVSTASEEEWFDNIVELGWQLYLCSSPPYLLQSVSDRRMRAYTDLAFSGTVGEARAVRDSRNPVRAAFATRCRSSRTPTRNTGRRPVRLEAWCARHCRTEEEERRRPARSRRAD